MPSIKYFTEDVSFRLSHPRKTSGWINSAISSEGMTLGEVNFIFCSDSYLHSMNVEYLNHNTLTDIITFDNSEQEGLIEGDIFISIDRVKENAKIFSRPFDEEIHRVIIHGILHLIGYSDKTPSKQKQMREKEDAYLSLR